METLQGHSIIAGESVPGDGGVLRAVDPTSNDLLDPEFSLLGVDQVGQATASATRAFPEFSRLEPATHARFLESVAAAIEAVREPLLERAILETGLPRPRLEGEFARTTNQIRLFAKVVRRGDHRGVRVDPAQPDRSPLPRPDIRQVKIPLGPVAVFGASNFPLAFSTAGGDTASALAAGCPVVFKAHEAHPGTSEIVGRAIADAVAHAGLPGGVFSLVQGRGADVGQALVADPAITAVGFTGSRAGGLAIAATAAARPVPIPVYAEMSSINPVVVLEGVLEQGNERMRSLATGYANSVSASSGQLCTVPGVIFVPVGDAGDAFERLVAQAFRDRVGETMLTGGIHSAWKEGIDLLGDQAGVTLLGSGTEGQGEHAPAPTVFRTSADALRQNTVLEREVFGAASLVIRYDSLDQLTSLIADLEGQLTGTVHMTTADEDAARQVLDSLVLKVGRVIVNGWPTGVEVCEAVVHGGPFPATSDSRTTSVGTLAIDRFLRPVAYQDVPDALLPEPLKDHNPWELTRLVDGEIHAPRR